MLKEISELIGTQLMSDLLLCYIEAGVYLEGSEESLRDF